jgi:DNA segregation ATPase FtsK/SpoIIIE, S-DNA-T family
MNRLRLALGLFIPRPSEESEDATPAWERMSLEIKGSSYALIALFQLVALTSYLPLDSYNVLHGRLDHVHNLGGIVGAVIAEGFLGTLGILGYFIVLVTVWLAFTAFRGIPLKEFIFKVIGSVLAALLGSISFHLAFQESFPETSLLQGGIVGKFAGEALKHYFNTPGAILIVLGGFIIVLILTTGLSFTRFFSALFENREEEEQPAGNTVSAAVAKVAAVPRPQPAPAEKAPAKPRRSRKKKQEEKDGEGDPMTNEDGDSGESGEENGEAPAGGPIPFQPLVPFEGSYSLPTLRLLKPATGNGKKLSRGEMRETARKLTEHLLSFQITGEVVAVSQGPVLTTYEYKPSAGVKLSKIANLQDDLGIVLGTSELRIIAPIPGKTVVGIEVPRPQADVISLKECLAEGEFTDKKIKIPFALGRATDGAPVFGDITASPHLLVAGATGSGKSVFVNSLIMSFLFRLTPQQLRLILVDPKMLELSVFDGIPHLVTNVITDSGVAFNALSWAVEEMERRYALMAETNSKNIDSFNSKTKIASEKLPYIVIVVDELADLMLSGGDAVEISITRLAQKARAAGVHLVIATQRPSTDVITGLIKANIPSRLSFKVPSGIDSRTVLDTGGAEALIGRGDSLMIQPGIPLRRLHGCYVTEEELVRVVNFVKGGRDHSKNYINFGGSKK